MKGFFWKVIMLQFIFVLVVFWDIPVATEAFGFLYLVFVPGYLILRVIKLKNLHWLETILFSAGFSLALLMIVGLVLNEFGRIIGVSNPLSKLSLWAVLSSVVIVLSILDSSLDSRPEFRIAEALHFLKRTPFAFLFLLPLLSVIGAMWVNVYENNSFLLSMIVVISVLVVAVFFYVRWREKLLTPRLYPLVVLMIAVSLLFHRSLISSFVQSGGSDIYLEFTVLKTTANNMFWDPASELFTHGILGRYNNMLSITILPTIFSSLLDTDPTWVLKIFFPLIFSLVPLALYRLWQSQLGTRVAFFSAFLFMAQATFYTEMLSLARQMIAELFFCLLLVLIFKAKMQSSKKMVCFAVFSLALVVSHYAMSIIFLSFALFTWLLLTLIRQWRVYSTKITITAVILFSVLTFSWYIYTSNSVTFESILQFVEYIQGELGEWANPAARETTVLRGLGLEVAPSIFNLVGRGVAYLTQFLILVGFVGLFTGRLGTKLGRDYLSYVLLAMTLLAGLILVPGLAQTLNMTRFYHILLFFLSPLCILGADFLVKLTFKHKAEIKATILVLGVLIPYFLFQTNFVYEVVGSDSWSLPLSKYRMDSERLYGIYAYIDAQSASGASWLSTNLQVRETSLYADAQALSGALTYYDLAHKGPVEILTNVTEVSVNGTVYLNRLNIVDGIILGSYNQWNLSELSFLNDFHLVYSNGDSEIFKKP